MRLVMEATYVISDLSSEFKVKVKIAKNPLKTNNILIH